MRSPAEIVAGLASTPLGGTGEASTPTTPPAVLNAVYAATKKRIRVLPALQKDLA